MPFTAEEHASIGAAVWAYQSPSYFDELIENLMARVNVAKILRSLKSFPFEELPDVLRAGMLTDIQRAINIGEDEEVALSHRMLTVALYAAGFKVDHEGNVTKTAKPKPAPKKKPAKKK